MSVRPTISVVIPAYKHAAVIGEAVESALSQTRPPLEVIVVNDGSPDNTEEVLQPWREAGSIRYFRQENQGQSRARNRGISEARGDYIALLDDDDIWPHDKLEWQAARLDQNPDAVLVYGGVADFSSAKPPTRADASGFEQAAPHGQVTRAFLRRNWIVSPGQTLIRRSALQAVGGFDPEIWGCDDYDLYIRLSEAGLFEYSPRLALHYRRHAQNASGNIEKMYANSLAVHRKHWARHGTVAQAIPWLVSRWHLQQYYFDRYLRSARALPDPAPRQAVRTLLRQAARVHPLGVFRRSFLRLWLQRPGS